MQHTTDAFAHARLPQLAHAARAVSAENGADTIESLWREWTVLEEEKLAIEMRIRALRPTGRWHGVLFHDRWLCCEDDLKRIPLSYGERPAAAAALAAMQARSAAADEADGLAAMDRRDDAINLRRDEISARVRELPLRGVHEIAALLDMVLAGDALPADHADDRETLTHLVDELARLAPGICIGSVRRRGVYLGRGGDA